MAEQFWVMFTVYANNRPRHSYTVNWQPSGYDGYSYGQAPVIHGPYETKVQAEAEEERMWAEDVVRDEAGRAWWR